MLQQISQSSTLPTGNGNINSNGSATNKQSGSPNNDITLEQMWTATPQTGKGFESRHSYTK